MIMLLKNPLITIFSSLFVNLAAAWFGVALITPHFSPQTVTLPLLTADVLYGTICLLVALVFELLRLYE